MDNVLELEKLRSVCGGFINDVNLDKAKAELLEDILTEVFNPKGSLDAINLMRFMLDDDVDLLKDLNNLYIKKLHTWYCWAQSNVRTSLGKVIAISDNEITFFLILLEHGVNLTVCDNKTSNILFDRTGTLDSLPTDFENGGNIKGCFDNLRDKYFLQDIEKIDLVINTFTSSSNALYPNGKTFIKVNIRFDGHKYESVFELPFNLTKESMWRLIKDNLKVVWS